LQLLPHYISSLLLQQQPAWRACRDAAVSFISLRPLQSNVSKPNNNLTQHNPGTSSSSKRQAAAPGGNVSSSTLSTI
jgi:hypothetical protein